MSGMTQSHASPIAPSLIAWPSKGSSSRLPFCANGRAYVCLYGADVVRRLLDPGGSES